MVVTEVYQISQYIETEKQVEMSHERVNRLSISNLQNQQVKS